MSVNKLWEKLFTKNTQDDQLLLHVSGATVRYNNPFHDLEVPRNEEKLTRDFIDKWVLPFYLTFFRNEGENCSLFARAAKEITVDDVKLLLGDFNWRMRYCGALFAAINNYVELDEIIGRHLVKSEVCYAGQAYCIALAVFNTNVSKEYLKRYLDYYLDQSHLNYDQLPAYGALVYVDKESAEKLEHKWQQFLNGKRYVGPDNWNIKPNMDTVDTIRAIMFNEGA